MTLLAHLVEYLATVLYQLSSYILRCECILWSRNIIHF